MQRHLRKSVLIGLSALALTATGCSTSGSGGGAAGDPATISMWTHSAGNPAEEKVIDQIISDFNASQDLYTVEKTSFPQGTYNDSIIGAATANDLPCLLDVDGPVMPNWAWAGWMQPLGIDETLIDGFLPGTLGYWNDELYSVGYWDAAVAMYTRQSYLDAHDLRTPTLDEPWTAEEYAAALKTFADSGDFKHAVDYGTVWSGEWWPYAFSPFLQSFGGDLVNRDDLQSAEGVLNGPEALAWGEWWQDQFEQGYAVKSGNEERTEFKEGKVALQWNGNWEATSASEAFDDVVFLPPPDLGAGPVIGAASWQWGISTSCSDAEAAGAREYIEFSLQPEYIAAFSDETGLIPASDEAAALTEKDRYGEGGSFRPFQEYAQEVAVIRPPTPAYANIALVFEKGARDIMNGADVQSTLDQMVQEIDSDIEANGGYQG